MADSDEIDLLKQRLEAAEAEIASKDKRMAVMSQATMTTKMRVSAMTDKMKKVEGELQTKSRSVTELQDSLEDTKRALEEKVEEVNEKEMEIQSKDEMLSMNADETALLKKNLTAARGDLKGSGKQVAELKQAKDELTATVAERTKQIAANLDRTHAVEQTVNEHEAARKAANMKVEQSEKTIEKLEKELKGRVQQCDQQDQALLTLEAKVTERAEAISLHDQLMSSKSLSEKACHASAAVYAGQLAAAKKEAEELRSQKELLTVQVGTLSEDVGLLKQQKLIVEQKEKEALVLSGVKDKQNQVQKTQLLDLSQQLKSALELKIKAATEHQQLRSEKLSADTLTTKAQQAQQEVQVNLKEATTRLDACKKELAAKAKMLSGTQMDKHVMEQKLIALEAQLLQAKEERTELTTKVKSSESEITAKDKRVLQLQEKLGVARQANVVLNGTVSEQLKKLKDSSDATQSKSLAVVMAEEDKKKTELKSKMASEKLKAAEADVLKVKGELGAEQIKVQQLTKRLQQSESKTTKTQAEVENLKLELGLSEKLCNALTGKLQATTTSLQEKSQQLITANDTIVQLKASSELSASNTKRVEVHVKQVQQQLESCRAELKATGDFLHSANIGNTEKEQQIETLEDLMAGNKERITTLEWQLSVSEGHLAAHRTRVVELEAEVHKERTAKWEAEQASMSFQAQVAEMTEQVAKAQTGEAAAKASATATADQCKVVLADLSQRNEKLLAAQLDLTASQAQCNVKAAEVEGLKAEVAQQAIRMAAQQTKVEELTKTNVNVYTEAKEASSKCMAEAALRHTAEEERQTAEDAARASKESWEEAKIQLSSKVKHFAVLQSKLETMMASLKKKDSLAQEAMDKLAKCEKEVQEKKQAARLLEDKMAAQDIQMLGLQKQVEAHVVRLKEMKSLAVRLGN